MVQMARSVTDPAPVAPGCSSFDKRVAAVLFALAAFVPFAHALLGSNYLLLLGERVMIFAIAALSLELLVGVGGLVSFGHAAFLGLGAYAAGILASHDFGTLSFVLPATLLTSALFAFLTGLIAVRTSGVYFIMITLAFGQMAFFVATALAPYGGDDGLTLPTRTLVFGTRCLKSEAVFFYVALGFLAATYALSHRLIASRFGRVLRGLTNNEMRMRAIGFAPYSYRLTAYVIAGTICGLAGFLLANQAEFVSPAYMHWQRSGELIMMVLVGGTGTLYGPIIGVLTFISLEETLSRFTEHWRVILGPLLIGVVLFARGGIAGAIGGRWRQRKTPSDSEPPLSTHAFVSRTEDCRGRHSLTGPIREPVLRLERVEKSFGALRVTDRLSLDILAEETHAIIGPNGAGKTTLIHQISGVLAPDAGHIYFEGRDVTELSMPARANCGLARSFQITHILPRFTALENVALALQARSGSSFRFWQPAADDTVLNAMAMKQLAIMGLAGRAHSTAGTLSHGEKRRLELAIVLAQAPKLLLLDEPMAGAGVEETYRLVETLKGLKRFCAIVLVEHDMHAVFALADRISVLVEGRIIATGSPSSVRDNPAVRAAYLGEVG
jgi:branched-chain amino acid transport system permease protein